jgi:transcriptional regulator with XRE-family HTH domain
MDDILGMPNRTSQGIPNLLNVRLTYMDTWNKRITKARIAAKLSKSELARLAGVSNPTVSDWESGEIKKLEAENLLKVCDAMRVSPRWLLYGKEEMNQYPEAALPRFTAREKLNPQELQNETVAYLSGMDLDDQNVWLATITAAANKSRRNKQEEKVSKDQGLNAHDPTSGKRHAA